MYSFATYTSTEERFFQIPFQTEQFLNLKTRIYQFLKIPGHVNDGGGYEYTKRRENYVN